MVSNGSGPSGVQDQTNVCRREGRTVVWICILPCAVAWGFHSGVTFAPSDVYIVWEGGGDLKHCLQVTRMCVVLFGQTVWNGDESHMGGL